MHLCHRTVLAAVSFAASTAVILAGSVSHAAPNLAPAHLQTAPFGKTGSWIVQSVVDAEGFNHCAARMNARDGSELGLLGFFNGSWTLQVYSANRANRLNMAFDATLRVDEREVLTAKAQQSGHSTFVYLSGEQQLAVLTSGRTLHIETPYGARHFVLKGTDKAARLVETCRNTWQASTPRQGSQQAETASPGLGSATNSILAIKPEFLSRVATMQLALRFLRNSNMPFEIIPEAKNPLRSFPVNWKTPSGVIGGMIAYKSLTSAPADALDRLISEQLASCKGKRMQSRPSKTPDLSQASAVAICKAGMSTETLSVRVHRISAATITVVVELVRHELASLGQSRRPTSPNRLVAPNEL